jgi:hypothetical protein
LVFHLFEVFFFNLVKDESVRFPLSFFLDVCR